MLWEDFNNNFSTKKASALGGSAPWTPDGPSPPLTIYPGTAPEDNPPYDNLIPKVST